MSKTEEHVDEYTVRFIQTCEEMKPGGFAQTILEVETQVFYRRHLLWKLRESPEMSRPKVHWKLMDLLDKGEKVLDDTPYALRRLLQLAEPSDSLVDKVKGKLLRLALRLLLPRDVAARLDEIQGFRA